ncbi:hypothetical protein ACSDQ9_00200 [Aestuariimicrobium soli]|uniref:hypothetical protein n=1 Tax=Aestuariimicrobium soli TaxID=2035834 RepID=UPI003EBE2EEF
MKPTKIVGIISFVAGLVMIVAGAVTWGVVTSQLKDERITVAADAAPVMGIKVAGKNVAGPITAFGQAEIIKHHATAGSDGKTYAELGALQTQAKNKAKELGVDDLTSTDADVVAKIEASPELTQLKADLAKYTGQRTTQMNGAFLRTSLFSSVITYGVAAFVVGMGLMNLVYGWGFFSVANRKERVAAE